MGKSENPVVTFSVVRLVPSLASETLVGVARLLIPADVPAHLQRSLRRKSANLSAFRVSPHPGLVLEPTEFFLEPISGEPDRHKVIPADIASKSFQGRKRWAGRPSCCRCCSKTSQGDTQRAVVQLGQLSQLLELQSSMLAP